METGVKPGLWVLVFVACFSVVLTIGSTSVSSWGVCPNCGSVLCRE